MLSLAAEPSKEIILKQFTISFSEMPSFVRITVTSDKEITLESAREVIQVLSNEFGERKVSLLIDSRQIVSMSREAGRYFAGNDATKAVSAVAVLVDSVISRVIANVVIFVGKPGHLIQIFNSETKAAKWLRKPIYRPAHESRLVPKNPEEIIYTEAGEFFIVPAGFCFVRAYPKETHTLKDAQDSVATFNRLAEGKKCGMLLDISEIRTMSKEAIDFYTSPETARYVSRNAILVGSLVSRFLGNLFLGVNRLPMPSMLFTSLEKAVGWLDLKNEISDIVAPLALPLNASFLARMFPRVRSPSSRKIEEAVEVLTQFARLNFNATMPMGNKHELLDALALAVNLLGKELGESTFKRDQVFEIFDGLGEMVFVLSSRGEIILSNATACAGLECSETAFRDKTLRSLIVKGTCPSVESGAIFLELHDRPQVSVEATLVGLKGKTLTVLMTFSCIEGDRPEASRIVCIARNISEDLRFESVQRMQTLVAQAAKMSALGEMAGGIAHEINNHLAVLLLRTTHTKTILEDSPIDKALVVRDLNKIEVAANRISKIVSGLKNLSRNADDDPFISVKIASIIEDTMSLCQERLKHAEIELKVDTIPDLSLECRPSQIAQVLLNLMNNAADAIAEHSAKWIEVQVREAGDRVHFLVTDSGNGISPEVARKLMQPFFTTKPLGKGTGLGLSISHQICEQHHGNLTYNSESKNTQFVIEIPKLKQAAAQA